MNFWKFLIGFLATGNLNVTFNLVECVVYHFRRLNFEISEDQIIMVAINWL